MAKLTDAQRKEKKIQSLEKTKLVIKAKLDVLNQALGETNAKLAKLKNAQLNQ